MASWVKQPDHSFIPVLPDDSSKNKMETPDIKDLAISFTINDIKYIVVESDDDKVEVIELLKQLHSQNSIIVFTVDQIKNDL